MFIKPISPKGSRPGPARIKRPSEKRSSSSSATRALDVLELFGNERRPLRAFEICRALAMSPSTADQILKTMVDSGHLAFDARGKTYRPSPRLIGFSSFMVATYGAEDRLRLLVRDLYQRVGMVVTLTTPNDLFMQVLDLAADPGHSPERGLRVAVFGSSIGSAYLSTLAEEDLAHLAYRARVPDEAMIAIRTDLAQIRRDGCANGPSGAGVWSLAVPLPHDIEELPLVLGLAGTEDRVRPRLAALARDMHSAIIRWI